LTQKTTERIHIDYRSFNSLCFLISRSSVVTRQLLAQQHHQFLTALRCIGDLAQAINWLPDGFLWAGKLEKWHCGVLGTVTSIISLYQAYQQIIINQKSK
jgi:hypothetical protein